MHDDRTTRVDPDERVIGGVTHESLTPIKDALWGKRAEEALKRALDKVRGSIDAIADVTLALDCLRAEAGELPPDVLADLIADYEDDGPACTCPPELVERGGFKGGCPVHGS
jgi:hypothetical protein